MSTATALPSYEVCCPPDGRADVRNVVDRLLARFRRWNTRRRDMRRLSEMGDHHLNDIGIRRSEIRSVVFGEAMDHAHRLDLTRTY
ncbi:MAG TPA: DUF1127 domain-containing protein [Afifellaceae bacterium]|nr:DUF1127 domain-containing protein [Afifellaceae bacterium]